MTDWKLTEGRSKRKRKLFKMCRKKLQKLGIFLKSVTVKSFAHSSMLGKQYGTCYVPLFFSQLISFMIKFSSEGNTREEHNHIHAEQLNINNGNISKTKRQKKYSITS
jgi:hypothetical protein